MLSLKDYYNINTEIQNNAFAVFNRDCIIELAFGLFFVLKVYIIYDVILSRLQNNISDVYTFLISFSRLSHELPLTFTSKYQASLCHWATDQALLVFTGWTFPSPAPSHMPHGRIESQTLGVIGVIIAGKPSVNRLPEQSGMSSPELRVSPVGRWLLFCTCDYSRFPVYQPSSDMCSGCPLPHL